MVYYDILLPVFVWDHHDGLMQKRHNSSVLEMDLCLFYTKP